MRTTMKVLNLITLALLIVGGVNRGLIALGGYEWISSRGSDAMMGVSSKAWSDSRRFGKSCLGRRLYGSVKIAPRQAATTCT
jgi:hypothetical protein